MVNDNDDIERLALLLYTQREGDAALPQSVDCIINTVRTVDPSGSRSQLVPIDRPNDPCLCLEGIRRVRGNVYEHWWIYLPKTDETLRALSDLYLNGRIQPGRVRFTIDTWLRDARQREIHFALALNARVMLTVG